MARYVRIEGGAVVNAEEWADAPLPQPGVTYLASDTAPMGATYDPATGVFTPAPDPLPEFLPSAHLKFILAGQPSSLGNVGKTMLDDAQAQITALNDPQSTIKFTAWGNWARTDPLVERIAGALNLSAAQFDALWLQAAAVQ